MSTFGDRVDRLAMDTDGGVIGMFGYIDPAGQWWIAPIGSPAPDPDRPMPPAWVPIRRLDRGEVL